MRASRAINANLTLRNWLIGLHIVEYEQRGTDCAEYGDRLIERLSRPEIRESLTLDLAQAPLPKQEAASNRASPDLKLGVCTTAVLMKLSFTHIAELLQCDESLPEGDNSLVAVAAKELVNSEPARASRNEAGCDTNAASVGIPHSTHTPFTPTKKYTACTA